MNTYQITQVTFNNKVADPTPKSVEVFADSPKHAYRVYMLTLEGDFEALQIDDIGSPDNPCVRYISRDETANKKYLFYIKKQ